MPSLTELQDALQNADKAGDTAAATRLADAIHAMKQTGEEKPLAVKAGEMLGDIPRQVGLAGRYAIEGPMQAASMFTEPIRHYITDPLINAVRGPQLSELVTGQKPRSMTSGEMGTAAADWLGLPKPQGANERVVADASRLLTGGGAMSGAGRLAAAAPGLLGQSGQFLSQNQLQQMISAGGSGFAGGAVREAGGTPLAQAGASLLGGVAAPMAASTLANAGTRVVNTANSMLAPKQALEKVDQQISLTLKGQGIDWTQIPERIKQQMRAEVQSATNTGGEMNPEAMRRLLDFKTVGATPTRGMLTQDPVQITREQNLAKTGANSTDLGLQSLPRVQNANTGTLLRNLDEMGAARAPDEFATSQGILGSLNRFADSKKNEIGNLYSAARDTSGRSADLNGAVFTQNANKALDEALLGGALPPDIASKMNAIAKGEVPFTVDYAEQLKTAMGKLQRASADGQTRMAISKVREALDNTPLRPAPTVNPGNLPAVPGTVPVSPAVLGEESINAFNQARRANASFMKTVEGTPALKAAMDDIQPDQFVNRFILSKSATVKDVAALRATIGNDAETVQQVKDTLVSHLRSAATNGTEDVTKFSPHAYNKALNNIGERKLAAFFDPEEITKLQAVGRVGTLMEARPAGSAVNSSNTGAMMAAKAMDMLDVIAGRIPFGGDKLIQGTLRGVQQAKALNVPKALLAEPEQLPFLSRLGPAAIYSGLLSTQPINQR